MTKKTRINPVRFGAVDRVSDSDSRLIAYGLDEDGDEDVHLEVRCAIADPDVELATIRAVVDLVNARPEIVKALEAAEKLLSSVAHVSEPGDTKRPPLLIRAALAVAGGAK